MSKLLFLIALISAYLGWNQHKHRLLPSKPVPKEVISCGDKSKCLLVYVAPWCTACHQMAPTFQHLLSKSKSISNLGVKIIVGGGRSPEENQSMANMYGADAVLDNEKLIHNSLNVTYYPSVYLLNEKHEIIQRDEKAIKIVLKDLEILNPN